MPEAGTIGTQEIPNPASGFPSRPAGIYLPPAALVPKAPALPLVVLMMGQPGNPDPQYVAAVLDQYAADHQGLAPIVIVADQLGDPLVDSLCLDTPVYGNVETFINKDVLAWANNHLNVINDPHYRTIAGYSHGGQCAISFAAKYPQLWGNVLDISGEEYPGAEHPDTTLRDIFGGDRAAYDAQKPVNILHAHHYPDTAAVFTVSNDDPIYVDAAKKVQDAATSAGMTVTYIEIPNAGHVIGALNGGLREGFGVLYPRLGFTGPEPAPQK
jgi:enterochelin esterase-like enzyme